MTTASQSLYRRILGEIAADDPESYAPPMLVSLIMMAALFIPWRWVVRVGVIGLVVWLVWSVWATGIVR